MIGPAARSPGLAALSDAALRHARRFHADRLAALNEEAQRRIFRKEEIA